MGRPSWRELRGGVRPPQPSGIELGEWQHGWQYHGSSSLEYYFRESVVFAQSCPANQAHIRSHSGPGSSAALHGAPTTLEFTIEPFVQDIGPGEIATASCCDRGQVRMWHPLGRVQEAQGCMPTFREVADEGRGTRTNPCPNMPRGWCDGSNEHETSRHERRRGGQRRAGH